MLGQVGMDRSESQGYSVLGQVRDGLKLTAPLETKGARRVRQSSRRKIPTLTNREWGTRGEFKFRGARAKGIAVLGQVKKSKPAPLETKGAAPTQSSLRQSSRKIPTLTNREWGTLRHIEVSDETG